jgi:dTDP-4-dehydrorhamnose reductase
MGSQNFTSAILVTGAGGQLANEIRILASGFPQYRFFFTTKDELTIDDSEALQQFFDKHRIHYCINCAAYTAVDKAESEKEKAFKINAEAVGELAALCRAHKAQLIHISTDYVYDGTKEVALKEDNAVAPLNTYGWSKLQGEELALKKNPSSLIIRTSWVYSSFGNNFVKTMLRLFKEKEEINVVSDQFGSPTYAADLAEIIMEFINRMEQGKSFSGIVNNCNEGITNWFEFADEIKRLVRSDCRINPISSSSYVTAAKRPKYSVLDTSKIQLLLGADIPDWKISLKKCLQKLNP